MRWQLLVVAVLVSITARPRKSSLVILFSSYTSRITLSWYSTSISNDSFQTGFKDLFIVLVFLKIFFLLKPRCVYTNDICTWWVQPKDFLGLWKLPHKDHLHQKYPSKSIFDKIDITKRGIVSFVRLVAPTISNLNICFLLLKGVGSYILPRNSISVSIFSWWYRILEVWGILILIRTYIKC